MNTFDDLEDMASLYLDATTTERLISGAVEIDDAPPGFERVAGLINKAQGTATAGELAARAAIVRTFAARVRSRPIVRERTKRTFAFPKFPARVLALAAPVVLLGGSVAAGTDSLPPSAQAAVSRALSSLGISVPKGHNDNHGIAGSPPSNTGRTAAIDTGSVAGPRSQATVGLCRAWMERVLNNNGTAYRKLAAAAGGAGRLPAYCAGAPVSSVVDGATGRAQNPSFTQLDGRKGVTKPSTTGIKKTVARSRREGIAIRQSGAVAPGRAAASTSTPPTTWQHGPKAAGSSRPPVVSSGRPTVSGGLQVPRGTHKATTSGRSRGHRPSTRASPGRPLAFKSSTEGKSSTTSPVWTSPVSSSLPVGRGPSHHSQSGPPGQQRGCIDSVRPGQVIQAHPHCHPAASTASKSNATSTGSGRHGARPPRRVHSVGSKPRSVKHHNRM